MKVLSLAFPGMTLIDLVGPLQPLAALNGFESQIAWKSLGPVPSDAGLSVVATHTFDNCWTSPDILLIPGGSSGLFKMLDDDEVIDWIAARGKDAAWVASVCNGSLLLAAAGLLKGYKAAAYWYAREYLSMFGATPCDARVVIDRNRATGGGATAGIDFGIAMVGAIDGQPKGKLIELLLEYAPQPPYGTGRPEGADQVTLATANEILKTIMPYEVARATSERRQALERQRAPTKLDTAD